MVGDLVYDATGKSGQNVRVLPDGKVESSFQHKGKLWGEDGWENATAMSTWRSDGTFSFELHGFFLSMGGDLVNFMGHGIGWPTGPGLKASIRGSVQYWTMSQKLMAANKTIGAFEVEVAEDGSDQVKA